MAEKEIVVVLVIDSFKEPNVDVNSIPENPGASEGNGNNPVNCIVMPDGQTYATGGVSTKVHEDRFHGELVYDVLVHELSGENLLNSEPKDSTGEYGTAELDWVCKISEWDLGESRILVVAVDTDDFNTTAVSDRIDESIDHFAAQNFSRFVLNMSFAILPCEGSGDYLELFNDFEELAQLQEELEKRVPRDSELFSEIIDLVTSQKKSAVATKLNFPKYNQYKSDQSSTSFIGSLSVDFEQGSIVWGKNLLGDSLCTCLNKYHQHNINVAVEALGVDNNDRAIIYPVAAAGNAGMEGYNHPFAPAMFDGVISVGSLNEDTSDEENPQMDYSNQSEILMDGLYLDGKERGTSFAAPRFSARAAIYLHNGGAGVTTDERGRVVRPSLGLGGINGPWKNKKYSDAREEDAPDGEREKWPES